MNKPALIALTVAAVVGGAVVTFNACTASRVREDAPVLRIDNMDTHTSSIPTADALFLKGKYMIKSADASDASELSEDHSGQDLDLQTHRPVYDLTDTLFAKKYAKPGYTLVANFFHEGAFYIARIPDENVLGVFFGLALTPPKSGPKFFAGQTFIRLQMEPTHPVELVAEMPDEAMLAKLQESLNPLALLPNENAEADPRVENFAISSEAVLTKAESKEPMSWGVALRGAYTQALSFRSLEESFVTLYKSGEPVNEYKLHVSPDEGHRIMAEALRESQAEGLSGRYTFAANCTSKPFAVLRSALATRDDRFAYLQKMMDRKIPTAAPKVLADNGLEGEIPLQLDRSLGQESNGAFGRVFGARDSDICKTSKTYRGYHCDTIRAGVAALEKWGRLPASTAPQTDLNSADDREPATSTADDKAEAADEHAQQELKKSARKKGLGASSGYEGEEVLH